MSGVSVGLQSDSNYFVSPQICESLQSNDWKVEHPNPNAMGPYAYKGNQWVGYDDINIVQLKVGHCHSDV